jgi:hypothetical protein
MRKKTRKKTLNAACEIENSTLLCTIPIRDLRWTETLSQAASGFDCRNRSVPRGCVIVSKAKPRSVPEPQPMEIASGRNRPRNAK